MTKFYYRERLTKIMDQFSVTEAAAPEAVEEQFGVTRSSASRLAAYETHRFARDSTTVGHRRNSKDSRDSRRS